MSQLSSPLARTVRGDRSMPAKAAEPSTRRSTKKQDLKDVKVALWGFGNQNKLMAKYLHERGVPIVAVISHHDIGKDYTTVDLGRWGKNLGGEQGVKIVGEPDAQAALLVTQPDICIMCTRSTLQDIQPSLTVCAESKVNVLTIAEELYNSRNSSPSLTKEMDALFRENGVSLTGSGAEDVSYIGMFLTMSALMHRIDGLEGSYTYSLDDYGPALAAEHGAGLTPAQFQKQMVETAAEAKQSFVGNLNDLLVSAFGLTLKETKERYEPTFASVPIWSSALKREIPAGDCTGSNLIATTTTEEGISIKSEFIGKCYGPNDVDQETCGFLGEPSGVQFTMSNPPSSAMTNTATISRILHVVNAPAGYITIDQLSPVAPYEDWT